MRMSASTPSLGSSAWTPAAVQSGQLGAQSVKNVLNLAPRNMRPCARGARALLTEGTSSRGVHFTKVSTSWSLARSTHRAPSTLSEHWLSFQLIFCGQSKVQNYKCHVRGGIDKNLGNTMVIILFLFLPLNFAFDIACGEAALPPFSAAERSLSPLICVSNS